MTIFENFTSKKTKKFLCLACKKLIYYTFIILNENFMTFNFIKRRSDEFSKRWQKSLVGNG